MPNPRDDVLGFLCLKLIGWLVKMQNHHNELAREFD